MFIAELNAEDLMSGFLLPRPRPVIPFSFSHCSVYKKPVSEATNGQLPKGLRTEGHVVNRESHGSDHAGCASVGVSTLDHCNTFVEDRRDDVEDTSITSSQDQRDTRISDVNHDPVRSLAKIQRSRSRQRALELRSSAKVAKSRLKDASNSSSYSGASIAVPSFQDDQPEELNKVKTVDNSNNICAVEEIKIGDPWSKEKGNTIYSTKGSGQQQRSLNGGSSSNVVREDGAMLADSIGPSIQQSNHVNQPLESVNDFQIDYENCMMTEAKVGENRSKEKGSSIDCMRITRSRSGTQQTNYVSELVKLDSFTNNQKKSGSSSLIQEAQLADQSEIVQFAETTKESGGLKAKVGGSGRKKRTNAGYSGRITRSRSSSQPRNTVNDLSKPVRFSSTQENLYVSEANAKEHSTKGSTISAERSLPIRDDQLPCAANSTDSSDKEDGEDECVDKNARTSITEGTSKLVNSQELGCRVTRSKSAALNKHPETKLLNSSEDLGPDKVSSVDVIDLPGTSTSQPANLEGCAATTRESDIDPDGPVEDHPVCSGSNLEGPGLVELKSLAPCPADCSMVVEPKQLNFDDVETSSINGVSAPSIKKVSKGRLLDSSPLPLSESAGIPANGISEQYQENLKVLSKEEKPQKGSSEACVEDKDTAIIALNGYSVSSVKETPHAEKDVATHNLQQSDNNSKEKFSLRDYLVTSQVARESVPGSLLKEVTSSNISYVDANSGMNLSFEIEIKTPGTAIPSGLVSIDGRLETISSVDHKLSKGADFPLVTKPGPFEIQGECTDPADELPCPILKDETSGNLAESTVNPEISEFLAADSSKRSTHDATDVGLSQSAQRQTAAKSMEKASCSASLDGSLTRNKRKRSGSLDTLFTSPDVKENAVLPVNKDSEIRDLAGEEHSLQDIPESRDLQIPQDDVHQLVLSRSSVEGMHQSEEDNMQNGSKSSLKLQVEEVFSFSRFG